MCSLQVQVLPDSPWGHGVAAILPDSKSGRRWFESSWPRWVRSSMVEHLTFNQGSVRSSRTAPTLRGLPSLPSKGIVVNASLTSSAPPAMRDGQTRDSEELAGAP